MNESVSSVENNNEIFKKRNYIFVKTRVFFFFEDNKWIKKLKTKTIMIPPQHLVFSLQVQVFRRFYTNQIPQKN